MTVLVGQGEWYCRRCQTGADTDDEQQSTLPSSPAEKETALSMSPTVPYVSPQGRVHMIAPSARSCGVRRERNTHKHKRLFEYGATGALQVETLVKHFARSMSVMCMVRGMQLFMF